MNRKQIIDNKQITVTSPLLPPLEEFILYLQEIWDSRWITNNGEFHQHLEKALAEYLGVEYISLFTNGTLPLITALQALDICEGEVITTPYSFVATSHAIWWNGLTPVFVGIDPVTGCMDPDRIEEAITERTRAIMPVHVYGTPCDTERIQQIADKHGLKVIYDAAHAFGVKKDGKSILLDGDMSTLSFHATKTYNTIEGGALICHSAEMKYQIDNLKNFGFRGETNVVAPGINSKMDEVRAAYGLLNLKYVDAAIARRKEVARQYVEALRDVQGIRLYQPIVESLSPDSAFMRASTEASGVELNYSYFPIFVDAEKYGMTRDELYEKMKQQGIYGRRYFYPLITDFEPYRNYPSAAPENLPVATKFADEVICLPMHHALSEEEVERVIECIIK
ncbi:MAG: DegT/DnrJ/EryC1/StrS family aminotransferase [Paludibacteraceae bacterium]|nr:DegT/DnrJ/EryC1/StrS family aminotransferase [Paludibacteraceae bacterium]